MSNPTPAAMRAAETILFGKSGRVFIGDEGCKDLARIIDRKTGLAELVEALQDIANAWNGDEIAQIDGLLIDAARRALSRHQNKQTEGGTA